MNIYDFFVAHGFILEMLAATALFTHTMGRKSYFALRAVGMVLLLFAVSVLCELLLTQNAWTEILRYILLFNICLLGVKFSFRVRFWQALFYMTAAGVVQHLVFKAARLTSSIVFREWFRASHQVLQYGYAIMTIPFFLIFYLLFVRRLSRVDADLKKPLSTLFPLIGMLLCVNIFHNLFEIYNANLNLKAHIIFSLLDITSCLFMLQLQCEIVGREQSERNNYILEHMLYQQKKQLEAEKETIELINVKCHDLKHQLAHLEDHIPQELIVDLGRTISIYDLTAHTGNDALDTLLTRKSLFFEQKQIRFDYIADGNSLSFMKPTDVYAMFGNALDNAMEAVEKMQDIERRYIGMKIWTDKGMVMIHIENYYDGELCIEGELPRTTKRDTRYHGFGMKSIKMIVDKYGGDMSIHTGELFTISILIPIPIAQ